MDSDKTLSYESLAVLLRRACDEGVLDKEQALRDFGATYVDDLRTMEATGRTLLELAERGQVSLPHEYNVKFIREGMEIDD